jgi:hypothetical protein
MIKLKNMSLKKKKKQQQQMNHNKSPKPWLISQIHNPLNYRLWINQEAQFNVE